MHIGMKLKVPSLLLFAIAFGSCYASSHYQNSQIQLSHLQRHTETLLDQAQTQISVHLTHSERLIQRRAKIRVPASYALIAHAYAGAIEISGGTMWILEQLAMAHIVDHDFNYEGCEKDYTNYIANGITQSAHDRGFVQLSLQAYGAKIGGACGGFDVSEIIAYDMVRDVQRLMQASMMLVYLHELGHHVLGHVDRIPDALDNVRQLEAAADAWTIEVAYRSGINVLDGVPALNLIAALNAGKQRDENTLTHPHGLERIRNMTHRAIAILASQGKADIVGWLNNNLLQIERKMPGS
ncbi:MAG: hypothetical protein HKN34_06630 [Gammaproteobacteria bacterium]|nr:hypothetical protein [Gammaproteobacteria bacterium]